MDPWQGVEGVVEPEVVLSCWANNVVTSGAIIVNIAAIGSTAEAVDVELAVAPGPVRPRGFASGDGVTFQ